MYIVCVSLNSQVLPLFAEAEKKNRLLRSVAGGGIEQLGDLRSQWEKFEIMMESHQLMIQEQVRFYTHTYTCTRT